MKSQYQLKEAKSRAELDSIVEVMWIAQYDPYRIMFQSFFPVMGPTTKDREAAIEESKERLWKQHCSSEMGHWFYVEDVSTGEVVGSTHWQVQLASAPHSGPLSLEATWWPPGEAREFATEVIRQTYAPRHRFLTGPYVGKYHLLVNIRRLGLLPSSRGVVAGLMSVLPSHRGRGVGNLLMAWGVQKAEELGYQSWMEATETGRGLYEKFGYQVLFKVSFDDRRDKPSGQWRKLQHELTPEPFYAMWRPVKSQCFEDGVVLPWKVKSAAEEKRPKHSDSLPWKLDGDEAFKGCLV